MNTTIPKKPTWLCPVVPLEAPNVGDEEDKKQYISMYLKTRAGSGDNGETYKTRFYVFDDGTPQEWVDCLNDLHELWRQNSVTDPTDRIATVRSILRNDALSHFDVALEDLTKTGNASSTTCSRGLPANVTADLVNQALQAVTMAVFPHRALEMQKSWMRRGLKKPKEILAQEFSQGSERYGEVQGLL